MAPTPLSPAALAAALALRDLTDDAAGSHALQLVLSAIEDAVRRAWQVPVRRHRLAPVVAIADNYDRLGYPPEAVTRDARHTRYVDTGHVLRSQTSAMIPPLLRALAAEPADDVVLSCPGLVYRRDAIDRLHVGEPHQVDVWRVRSVGPRLTATDLHAMISLVVTAALPGRRWRTVPATHPYTTHGLQIDVADGDDWVEIGECGLAAEAVLGAANLDPRRTSGLAMGLGLDRLLPVDAHARAVVAEAGSLDVSFNLIARGDVQGIPLAEMTTADFVRPITTGITTTFITARAAARHMVAQGSGVILALNSGSAHGSPMMGGTGRPTPRSTPTSATWRRRSDPAASASWASGRRGSPRPSRRRSSPRSTATCSLTPPPSRASSTAWMGCGSCVARPGWHRSRTRPRSWPPIRPPPSPPRSQTSPGCSPADRLRPGRGAGARRRAWAGRRRS